MRCQCPECYCRNNILGNVGWICPNCLERKHDTKPLTKQEKQKIKEQEDFLNATIYAKDKLFSCFCELNTNNCAHCNQHRGKLRMKYDKELIKREYLGGKFKTHDPEDIFGYELNMYSQRILRTLV